MKRLIAGFGVACWLASVSLGAVAAQGPPESVPNNSVGIAMASARTSDTEASGKPNVQDIGFKYLIPGGGGEDRLTESGSVSTGGSGGEDRLTENVTLN